jgi:serine/threonine protein kinase
MADLVGQSVDRYRILEQLGEGGMATVYKAYDTRLDRNVAVKFIRTENLAPDLLEQSLKRFEREAKALGKLTHPNIVSVSDYGQYEGRPYLVMEYLPGGTLKQKLGKPMPWREAIQLLLPIAEALDYAHSQNMIHRDVKPANILLTQRGQPMLTDFGIAKILDLNETVDLTGTSMAVGTPDYMAPEQATAKTVDSRADIYSLGIVLYEMVTGRRPFMADTPLAVMFKQASDPLPSPKRFVPDLPDGVEKILWKALAKQPENRYQSMDEFAAALKRQMADIPMDRPAYPQPRPVVQEAPTLVDTGPAVPTRTGVVPPPPPRKSCLPWVGIGVIVLCGFGLIGLFVFGVSFVNVDFGASAPSPTVPPSTSTSLPTLTPLPVPTLSPVPTPSPVPLPVIGLFPDADTVWNDWTNQRIQSLRSFVAEKWDLDAGFLAGQEYFRFTAKLSQSQVVLWENGWCTVDEQTLNQNLAQMDYEYSIDDQPIPRSEFGTKYYVDNRKLPCYVEFVVLKDWPLGTHLVRIVDVFKADTNDGLSVYPAGRKVIEIFITILP